MKKRIFLALAMVAMLVCMLAISAGAVSTTGNIDYEEEAILADGKRLPIYDQDKNPLIWYISGTETVTVDGVETTKNIYSSVVSTATKASPDKNGYYVIYNGSTKTHTGPTGEELPYFYSTEIWIKHTTDTSVNFKGDDTMVVANLRGVNIGDFQGGTTDKLQYFYAPDCMVRSGDYKNSPNIKVLDYTQSTSLRELLPEFIKTRNIEFRFPELEPVLDEKGVLINAFTVGNFAFQSSTLSTISFPKTLYKINKNAFQNCNNLKSLGYTPYLTIIEADAFHNASSITEIDFKSLPLQSIGKQAFWNAGLQANIELPNTLTSIGEKAFYQAKFVKSIKLPENLETLGSQVFREISTLEYFDFNGFELETMGDYFFYKNSSLRAVSLPEGLKSFGTRPFEGCSKLEALYLPDSLTTLTYFNKIVGLYFVNEPFSIEWTEGIFDSETWNGKKPAKPEIYYMPESLTAFSENDLHTCTGINDTIVFPAGITQVPSEFTFFAIPDRNFVFLGKVTLLNVNSTQKSNYYFINDNVTAETLVLQGNGSHNLYFHSAGAHLTEKRNTVANADCVTDEKAANICFCGIEISVGYVDGTALGHSHTVPLGIVYDDYFANGYIGHKCERCEDVSKGDSVGAIFEWIGYSSTETAIGGSYSITQGYYVDRVALNAYVEQQGEEFSFGVVAAVNKTDDAITPDFDGKYTYEFENLIHDCFEIKITGLVEGQLTTNIIMCAYVLDNGELYFLDNEETKTELTGVSYEEVLAMQK